MASNTQKSQKRNRIEMIGSAAANTFTNAAAVAFLANPALAVNPANIPAPQARTTSLKLVASNPISYVPKPKPHTPQGDASKYQIVAKKGDTLGEVTLQGTPRISGIDNNGNVLYGATTANGWFAYFRNREVLWHSYQEIDGFKTGSGDFSNAVITPEGDTYIVLGGTNEQSGKAGYIVLRNGQVAFDSTKEVPGVIDIISFQNNRGLTYHNSTGQIAFRYSYQEPGQPWQSGEKMLGTSPLFNKYTGANHFHVPPDHSGFHAYDPIESQNGKHAAFYGYDEAGTFLATMGGRAKLKNTCSPSIYTFYINGINTTEDQYKTDLKNLIKEKLLNNLVDGNTGQISVPMETYDITSGLLTDINQANKQQSYNIDKKGQALISRVVDKIKLLDKEEASNIQNCPAKFLLIGHSRGTLFIRDIANLLPDEIAKKTVLLAIAPAFYISQKPKKIRYFDYLLRKDDVLYEYYITNFQPNLGSLDHEHPYRETITSHSVSNYLGSPTEAKYTKEATEALKLAREKIINELTFDSSK